MIATVGGWMTLPGARAVMKAKVSTARSMLLRAIIAAKTSMDTIAGMTSVRSVRTIASKIVSGMGSAKVPHAVRNLGRHGGTMTTNIAHAETKPLRRGRAADVTMTKISIGRRCRVHGRAGGAMTSSWSEVMKSGRRLRGHAAAALQTAQSALLRMRSALCLARSALCLAPSALEQKPQRSA